MNERQLNMRGNITPEAEHKMQQLMEISCVHSVTWNDANNIDIIYIKEPNEEQKKQIKQLTI